MTSPFYRERRAIKAALRERIYEVRYLDRFYTRMEWLAWLEGLATEIGMGSELSGPNYFGLAAAEARKAAKKALDKAQQNKADSSPERKAPTRLGQGE
jgi:hypothetical protein